MTCEKFSSGTSFLHRCDPRVKIVLLALFAWVIATLDNVYYQFVALVLASGASLWAFLPWRMVLVRLIGFNAFCLLIWLTAPFTSGGEVVAHIFGKIEIFRSGLQSALEITLKSNTILLMTLALLSTSTVTQITHALAHLRCPSRVVQLFYFTWRYIHVISEEEKKIKDAMKLRGFRWNSTSMHTYKYIGYYLSAIFIKSYDVGIQVQRAMTLRGFNGTFWLIDHFSLRKVDILFLLFCLMAITTLFWGDHFGFK